MKFFIGTLLAGANAKSLSKSVKAEWKNVSRSQFVQTWSNTFTAILRVISIISAGYYSKKGVEEMRDQLSQVMKTSKKISERQVTDTLAWFETAGAAPKVNIKIK